MSYLSPGKCQWKGCNAPEEKNKRGFCENHYNEWHNRTTRFAEPPEFVFSGDTNKPNDYFKNKFPEFTPIFPTNYKALPKINTHEHTSNETVATFGR